MSQKPSRERSQPKQPQKASIRPTRLITGVLAVLMLYVGLSQWFSSSHFVTLQHRLLQQYLIYTARCAADSGGRLKTVLKFIVKSQTSLAEPITSLSLAQMSPNGQRSTCVTGWNAQIFDSPVTTPQSIYHFASITKLFTADTVLALVRKHKLGLDDKLVNILPELQDRPLADPRVADITIEQLLLHQAGFDRDQVGLGDMMFDANPWCPSEVVKLAQYQLQFSPASQYAYSNVGYCLLARVIEEKYQQPYRKVIKALYHFERHPDVGFFDSSKLGLPNSAMRSLNERTSDGDHINWQALSSSAGLHGNSMDLLDMAKLVELQATPNVLSVPAQSFCEDYETGIQSCVGYGVNFINEDPSLKMIWRSGSLPVTASLITLDSQGNVFAVLSNSIISEQTKYQTARMVYQQQLGLQ